MNDLLKMSKTILTFEIDRMRSNKAIDRLEIQNSDPNKRKGFKIKSTNITRYVVNPAAGIIDPLKTMKIDVMLTVQPGEDISKVQDKFRLYCLDITDESVTKQNIDLYIKKNENNIKKASIGVKIIDKHDVGSNRLDSLTMAPQTDQNERTSLISKDQNVKQDSILYESVISVGISNVFQDVRALSSNQKPDGLEILLMEKENEIFKLKEVNSVLEKDISMIRGKILLGDKSKLSLKDNKMKIWKLLLVLLLGLIIGGLMNSSFSSTLVK